MAEANTWCSEVGRRFSRRRWLATAAGGMIVGGTPIPAARGSLVDATQPNGSYSVDAHVHVWTSDTKRYRLAAGFRRDAMDPPEFTPEQLLRHASGSGVKRIVLIQMSYYGFDNSYMLDTMARFPGVFSGVAVIDGEQPRPQQQMRRLAKLGVRGFRIYPKRYPPERWLDGPGMEAMWRCGAEEGLAMCCLINPDALLAVDRMCRRFPQTPVVIDHLARIGADGTIRDQDVTSLCSLARHPQVFVKVSAFYALGRKQAPYRDLGDMIRRVVQAYGPQRLMWGSDCPFQVQGGHTYRQSIELIAEGLDFLRPEDRKSLLRKTAEKVFFG